MSSNRSIFRLFSRLCSLDFKALRWIRSSSIRGAGSHRIAGDDSKNSSASASYLNFVSALTLRVTKAMVASVNANRGAIA